MSKGRLMDGWTVGRTGLITLQTFKRKKKNPQNNLINYSHAKILPDIGCGP